MVGRYCYRYNGESQEEAATWIGKPWRRLELLRTRTFYKGKCVDTQRTWSLNLGSVRLGLHLNVSLTRAVGADYSDEEHQ